MAFDPQAATAAYIDSLGADALAQAAAYTAGNHWLLLWGLVVSGILTWVIVRWGILDRVAARTTRRGVNLSAFVVTATFFALSSLLTLPWELYADWWRESRYGRTSQPLGDYLG
jgi:STE24 endopeptidase